MNEEFDLSYERGLEIALSYYPIFHEGVTINLSEPSDARQDFEAMTLAVVGVK